MKNAKDLFAERETYLAAETEADSRCQVWVDEWVDRNGDRVSEALVKNGSYRCEVLCSEKEMRALTQRFTELGYEADFTYPEYDEDSGYDFLVRFSS